MSESIGRNGHTEGEVYDLAGALHRVALTGNQTGGAATVVEITVLPGAGAPPHSDAREDLIWHVIEGNLDFRTAEGTATIGAGGSLFCERGSVHGFVNSGERDATVIMLAIPSGIEDFFREAASVLPAGVPAGPPPADAVAAFAELAARHGITLATEEGAEAPS